MSPETLSAPPGPQPAAAPAAPQGLPAPDSGALPASDRFRSLVRWESALVLALVATIAFAVAKSPQFLTGSNLFNIGLSNGEVAIMTLPMAMLIIAGDIDLSITSTLALSSSVLGVLWQDHWPMILIIVVVLILGAVLGAFNGFLVTRFGLPPLAVTIGTMTLYAGIAEIVLGSTIVSNFPTPYTNIGIDAIPGVSLSFSAAVFIGLAIVFGLVLHVTPFGRSVIAIGYNKEAALFAGIRVKRVKTVLYMTSGFIGALAGILYTFRLNTAEYDNGNGLVLSVIAIAFLGGIGVFGGKGSMIGVILSVVFFCSLQNALLLTNFPEDATGVVTGALLLISILAPTGGNLVNRIRGFNNRRRLTSTS
jgi:rhamnose transport system permease protein